MKKEKKEAERAAPFREEALFVLQKETVDK